MEYKIFFSWQSDLPNKNNRSAIKFCINEAIKKLNTKIKGSVFLYDESTLDKYGTPDIGNTIIDKINKADVFLCDISIINKNSKFRKTPNPNVLYELGYASSQLGWDKILCLFNMDSGRIEDLPFDINHKRIIAYSPLETNYKNLLGSLLYNAIENMLKNGFLYSPLKDNLKCKIDYCILEIVKQICCITYGTITMSSALGKVSEFLSLNEKELKECLSDRHNILGYFTKNDLQYVRTKLDNIFSTITMSDLYSRKWALIVLELIDWLRNYQWIISERNKKKCFTEINQSISEYDVVFNNECRSLLLKKIGNNAGQVLYSGSMPKYTTDILIAFQSIISENIDDLIKCFVRASEIANNWLDVTGEEFILDPDYYTIS